ncbi:MAG: Sec-independent protein translocase protein TatB [Actinomycetota bacterium]|nr:Sec-independent protein translocase protein TatB [Actinomycetota bacterium]
MFNIGGGELLVIALVALIVLGPERLPDAARRVGNFIGELKKMSDGFQSEFRSAMEVPDDPVVKPKSGPGLAPVTDLSERKSPKSAEPTDDADDADRGDATSDDPTGPASTPAAADATDDEPTDVEADDADDDRGHGHGDAATG